MQPLLPAKQQLATFNSTKTCNSEAERFVSEMRIGINDQKAQVTINQFPCLLHQFCSVWVVGILYDLNDVGTRPGATVTCVCERVAITMDEQSIMELLMFLMLSNE